MRTAAASPIGRKPAVVERSDIVNSSARSVSTLCGSAGFGFATDRFAYHKARLRCDAPADSSRAIHDQRRWQSLDKARLPVKTAAASH